MHASSQDWDVSRSVGPKPSMYLSWRLSVGFWGKEIRITNGNFAGMTAAEMASFLGRSGIVDALS